MAEHRARTVGFKRGVAHEYPGGQTLHGLARRHGISRNRIRVWVEKNEAVAFDEDARAADLIQACEARIAALDHLVGKQQARGGRVSKGGSTLRRVAGKRDHVRDRRLAGISLAGDMC